MTVSPPPIVAESEGAAILPPIPGMTRSAVPASPPMPLASSKSSSAQADENTIPPLDELDRQLEELHAERARLLDETASVLAANQHAIATARAATANFRDAQLHIKSDLEIVSKALFALPSSIAPTVTRSVAQYKAECRELADLELDKALLKRAATVYLTPYSNSRHCIPHPPPIIVKQIKALLEDATSSSAGGRYSMAADHLTSAAAKAARGAEKHPHLLVYRHARKEVATHVAQLVSRLRLRVAGMVSVHDGEAQVEVLVRTRDDDSTYLADMVLALATLDDPLDVLVDAAIGAPGIDAVTMHVECAAVAAADSHVRLVARSTTTAIHAGDALESIAALGRFLCAVFPPPARAQTGPATLARDTWKRYAKRHLDSQVPPSPAGLARFSAAVGAALAAEHAGYTTAGFFTTNGTSLPPIAAYSVVDAYLGRRRAVVLARARAVLCEADPRESCATPTPDPRAGAVVARAIAAAPTTRAAVPLPASVTAGHGLPLLTDPAALAFVAPAVPAAAADTVMQLEALSRDARTAVAVATTEVPGLAAGHVGIIADVVDMYLMHATAAARAVKVATTTATAVPAVGGRSLPTVLTGPASRALSAASHSIASALASPSSPMAGPGSPTASSTLAPPPPPPLAVRHDIAAWTPADRARTAALAHTGALYVADWLAKALIGESTWTNDPDEKRMGLARASITRQVAQLTALARRVITEHLGTGKSEVVRTLRRADHWWGELEREQVNIEEVLLELVARIKDEAAAIKPLVPAALHYYWIGCLYTTALHHILNEVLSWSDITATESEALCSMLQILMLPMSHFRSSPSSSSASLAMEDTNHCPWAPHYPAFRAVVELLNLGLREIMDRLRAGRYAPCLTAAQLQRLVVALFQDSENRRAALAEIAGAADRGLVVVPSVGGTKVDA
ncbi:hypothetical protein BC828DRAFT_392888 [Blastocladiella britannica]|nr:hypothetical protein BC828DRAFT_392888 [Blastocladiella britannica]